MEKKNLSRANMGDELYDKARQKICDALNYFALFDDDATVLQNRDEATSKLVMAMSMLAVSLAIIGIGVANANDCRLRILFCSMCARSS